MQTRKVEISEELFDLLQDELLSLYSYHWNDDTYHADDCGSKAQSLLESAWEDAEEV